MKITFSRPSLKPMWLSTLYALVKGHVKICIVSVTNVCRIKWIRLKKIRVFIFWNTKTPFIHPWEISWNLFFWGRKLILWWQERRWCTWKYTHFIYKKQHTFWKGFHKKKNLLNDFKKRICFLNQVFTLPPKSWYFKGSKMKRLP